jgi:hypothetical protein
MVDLKRLILLIPLLLPSSCAPTGYHYGTWSVTNPSQAFELHPNDACRDQRLVSSGALQTMNASVGKPNGFPKTVTSVDSISSTGYGPPLGFDAGPPASIQCYEAVAFSDGSHESGAVDMTDQTDGVAVTWTPQPPPVSPQQAAKNALAAEQFEAEMQQCADYSNEKMGGIGDASLEAQANETPLDTQTYIRNMEDATLLCQHNAEEQYRSVVGKFP